LTYCRPPPLHRSPQRTVEDLQQTVVAAEAHEAGERIVEHLPGRARPDRRGHRQQVPVGEGARVASCGEEVAQAQARRFAVPVEPGDALAVEAHDVGQHPPEVRPQQIPLLAENRRQAAARPLQTRLVEADRKGHFAFDAGHTEMGEHRGQVRVGAAC
jgi:hypothetical protein